MSEDTTSKGAQKLMQILEDSVQILIDDDNDQENESDFNIEEIFYDVIKLVEDGDDPDTSLEMILPTGDLLEKYLESNAYLKNPFLTQLFIHLLQSLLTSIKKDYTLPYSIISHLTEIIIDKIDDLKSFIVEKCFVLGSLIQNCDQTQQDIMRKVMQFIRNHFEDDDSIENVEALTGCLSDVVQTFKEEFSKEISVIELIRSKIEKASNQSKQAFYQSLGDICLCCQEASYPYIQGIMTISHQDLKTNDYDLVMSIVQMHICILNSFEAEQHLLLSVYESLKQLILLVTDFIQKKDNQKKQSLKDCLSLFLDIGVLYSRGEQLSMVRDLIWNAKTKKSYEILKNLWDDTDNSSVLYFNNVLKKLFDEQ